LRSPPLFASMLKTIRGELQISRASKRPAYPLPDNPAGACYWQLRSNVDCLCNGARMLLPLSRIVTDCPSGSTAPYSDVTGRHTS